MKKTVSDFIPLLYPEENYWLLKDYSLSVMFEVWPWSGEGRSPNQFAKAASTFAGLLEADLFTGATISLCTNVLPGPEPDLIKYMGLAHKSSSVLTSRLSAFDALVHKQSYIGINLPTMAKGRKKVKGDEFVRKFSESKKKIERICSTLPSMLEAIFEGVRLLSPDEAFIAWKKLLNLRVGSGLITPEVGPNGKIVIPLSPSEQLAASDIMCGEDSFGYAGMWHRTYSLAPPPGVDAAETYSALMKANYPSRITFNFHIPEGRFAREQALKTERALARFLALGQSKEPNLDKSVAIDSLLKEIREDASKLVDISAFVSVSGTRDELNSRADRLISVFAEIESELLHEVVYGPQAYFCWGIPGIGGARVPESRKFIMSSKTAARMVSVYGDFRGDSQPVMLFRNRQNSLVGFSPISERQAKWGGLIVAPSGSGKTFLANSILYHLANLKQPPFVGIIDMALIPSYQSIVSSLGGTTLLLDASAKHTINPFEFLFPLEMPPERHIAFLREVFLPSLIDNPSKIQLQFLERSLRRMYKETLDINRNPKMIEVSDEIPEKFWAFETWVDVREEFMGRYAETKSEEDLSAAMYAHIRMMPTIQDLLEVLIDPENAMVETDRAIANDLRQQLAAAFSGIRGKLFGGHTSTGISSVFNEDLIYVYFGDLVNFKDLLSSAFLVAHYYIKERAVIASDEEGAVLSKIFGEDKVMAKKSRKKVFFLDEIHNLGFSGYCMQQVERNYRQGRTLGFSTLAITQGLREIAENASGSAMIENAALTILLRHSTPEAPNEVAVGYITEKMGLSAKMRQLLMGLERTDAHSDMILLSEGIGTGVARYAPTAMERWIGTTHNAEVQVRGDLVKELLNRGFLAGEALSSVVSFLAELYPRGLARSGDTPREAKQKILNMI